jgi:hypothetical protein
MWIPVAIRGAGLVTAFSRDSTCDWPCRNRKP